jgi:hypothetical protein
MAVGDGNQAPDLILDRAVLGATPGCQIRWLAAEFPQICVMTTVVVLFATDLNRHCVPATAWREKETNTLVPDPCLLLTVFHAAA